jgi:imidazolonepropionase-like amidohydrolase
MNQYGFLSLLVFPTLLSAQPEQEAPPKPLAITHVTVIDATGAAAQPDMTVVISGDRITALGKTGKIKVPDNAQVVDATGNFLIPGLWDMHVHMGRQSSDLSSPLFIANGVTGVRIMWGGPGHLQWQKELQAEPRLVPRMAVAGLLVDGPKSRRLGPFTLVAATEAEGRQAVQNTKRDGYDFIKVYSALPREAYFALAAEAKKLDIPFVGHVPDAVSAAEASDAGQKSLEHLGFSTTGTEIALCCSAEEAELRRQWTEARRDPERLDRELLRRLDAKTWDTYDEQKALALFRRFVANGTWQCPTLTVLRSFSHLDDPKFTMDGRLKYMPPARRERWANPGADPRLKAWTKEDFVQFRRSFEQGLKLVGKMHRAGVQFLAGTDVANPYCFPGFSLHDELELLAKAGLAPMEALQTATRNPARYLNQQKDFGTVEQGKLADLVLLDADPLQDIKNTKKITAVIVGGKLLTREALDKMLAAAEAEANKK